MNKLLSAFLIGAVFGLGIAVSGMINPAKILNFFDIAGTWDPSLAFVMAGGLAVSFPGYRLIFGRRTRPVFEDAFSLPMAKQIDLQLIGGAAVFGIGWGIAGFCPGGAIPALGIHPAQTIIFLAGMIGGIIAARGLRAGLTLPSPA